LADTIKTSKLCGSLMAGVKNFTFNSPYILKTIDFPLPTTRSSSVAELVQLQEDTETGHE